MGLHLEPNDWQPLDEQGRIRVSDVGEERQIIRDGIQRLIHGALICPGCELPLALGAATSVATRLRCGYCEHEDRARKFVTPDVYDTVSNEVYVVAHVD
ncbi:MAG: hypothetical protein ACR2N5_04910 [Solirubrobacterales bacterium]